MNSSDVGGMDSELVSRFNEGQAPQEMHHLWDCAVAPVYVGYDRRVVAPHPNGPPLVSVV